MRSAQREPIVEHRDASPSRYGGSRLQTEITLRGGEVMSNEPTHAGSVQKVCRIWPSLRSPYVVTFLRET